ncbi:unnamed protein product [Amoebophrya sp. A25]|nr:unnamed protein product [Amoebophrya sp. A25]|eukprot:GSA25T00012267001.1
MFDHYQLIITETCILTMFFHNIVSCCCSNSLLLVLCSDPFRTILGRDQQVAVDIILLEFHRNRTENSIIMRTLSMRSCCYTGTTSRDVSIFTILDLDMEKEHFHEILKFIKC